jgi:hypothetical protein
MGSTNGTPGRRAWTCASPSTFSGSGRKGLYDVAIVVSEDSDLNEAVSDVYELRDHERWVAVENALPWSRNSTRNGWRQTGSAASTFRCSTQ